MRAIVQRVSSARVSVDGAEIARIGPGLLVYLGVGREDNERDVDAMSEKIANLRIFEEGGQLTRSVVDEHGEALVISQFTLYGDVRRGRRPDFLGAMPPERAEALYERFLGALAMAGVPTCAGRFGARMKVESANEGPVTILIDSQKTF